MHLGIVKVLLLEVIAKLPVKRQNAASDGKWRDVVTTSSLGDKDIAQRREDSLDESFAIVSIY